ncbi:MAG TPA: type VI secretion system lipoprotein TssJ [Burkholderiaceae bacterium]|nr:type VI secretion system lipoprotein TssJ [Burkholderiaceae bacterium]
MIRRRLLLSLVPAFGLAGVTSGAFAQTATSRSRRVALVIGNAQYAQAPLANPENDARLIAATLKALGFEVDARFNLKGPDFRRALRDFGRTMEDDDSASVFYYAGHGMQIDKRNYLLPVDLNLRDEGEVKDEAIDLEESLLGRIDRVRPRARIFIIDACRDNPFNARATRSIKVARGLAETAAPGALIAFSAAPGHVAEDGPPGTNSVYTRNLAQEMRAEGTEVEEMLKNVRVKVLRETQERQIPWVNTSMVVNFVFNAGPGGEATTLARVAPAPPATGGAASPARLDKALRTLHLSLQAQRVLNTDKLQGSASLALRVYVLRDADAFQRASFDSLYDNDETILGAALLRRETLHLRPGETRELALALGSEARVVAVFAAYRELERSQWRSVLTLPSDEVVPPARLDAQARQVQLAWTH